MISALTPDSCTVFAGILAYFDAPGGSMKGYINIAGCTVLGAFHI